MIRMLRFAARPLPARTRNWAWQIVQTRMMRRFPDRVVLLARVFPALRQTGALTKDANVLWIGCKPYTTIYYPVIERSGAQCWTIDIDPAMRPFGRSGRHITGDMLKLEQLFPARSFDAVLCNGVFGYGVDAPADHPRAFAALAAVTKPSGWVLIGWNTDRIADPLTFGRTDPRLEHAAMPGLSARYAVDGCTHVYDTYRRRYEA